MITAPRAIALDYTGAPEPLAAHPDLAWELPVDNRPGHTRLVSWNGDALLVEPGKGLLRLGATPQPDRWTRWPLDLASIGPGWQSAPAAVSRDGRLWRCEADGGMAPAGKAGDRGSHVAANGLPGGQCLLQLSTGEESFFELRRDEAILWRKRGPVSWFLPHENRVFLEFNRAIHCIERESGANQWSAAGPFVSFIGVVGDDLWYVRGDAEIAAVSTGTGERRAIVALVNNRSGAGVLDDRGFYHSTTGLRYQIYDLNEAGRLVGDHTILGSSTVAGGLSSLASDGRIAFVDHHGQLFLFDPSSPSTPVTLLSGLSAGAYPVIADGRLYVLDGARLLCWAG